MISSIASISSSSSATVRVEKATSEFLIGPDWTMNMDICDTINTNQMLAKDVVKALKKRLQHKNPKIQLLALTLLETMVKNCGDYVHFQIAEKNILHDMVKIVKKRADMHVRDKVLTLIGSWREAFGGPQGRHPQYIMAYEELRRSGVEFPRRSPDAAPIFTPPAAHAIQRHPQPGYGMPSSSSTRLDEVMAADGNFSLSNINSMRDILDLLADMLQVVDPSDSAAVKDEVIVDLVEQCRANQKKLMEVLATTGDEELLSEGIELNENLQMVLAKHDAIASGSPLPLQVTNPKPEPSEKHDSSPKPADVTVPNAVPDPTPSTEVVPARGLIDEDEEEEDDFALLARRHSKPRADASKSNDTTSSEAPSSPVTSNALVPVGAPAPMQTKEQDIIDLLSLTLSTTATTEQTPKSPMHGPRQGHVSSAGPGITYSSEAYPGKIGVGYNNYVAPWAQAQAQPQPQGNPEPQPQVQAPPANLPQFSSQPSFTQSQPGRQSQAEQQPFGQTRSQYVNRPALQSPHSQPQFPEYSGYIPPPWAATPGYLNNPNPAYRPQQTYSTARPTSSYMPRPLQHESVNREMNGGQKPFIPSYRLFEDLDVFGNTDPRFRATSNSTPSLSGSANQSMVGGRK